PRPRYSRTRSSASSSRRRSRRSVSVPTRPRTWRRGTRTSPSGGWICIRRKWWRAAGAEFRAVAVGVSLREREGGMRRGVPPFAVRVTGGPPIHEQGTDSAFVNGAIVRMRHYIGVHTIDGGGIDMASRRAARGGATALQIFTAIPKYYGDKSSIRPERVARFRAALAETGIAPAQVLVHAAYVLNTATSDETKWSRAAAGLRKELERSTALGVGAFCFHPGPATD